jgi:hypothetical protein
MSAFRSLNRVALLVTIALLVVLSTGAMAQTKYYKGLDVTSSTATTQDVTTLRAVGLTTGNLLQLILDDDALTTGNYLELFGGSDHATSVLAIGKSGELTGSGPKHYVSVPLTTTANTTSQTGVFVAQRGMTITKASIAYVGKPASAAGTVTLALANYDLSATTSDNLLSAATVDLEGLTNFTASDLTLTATAADLVLADGDYIYATIVSNNVDMSGGTGGVLTLEYTLQ